MVRIYKEPTITPPMSVKEEKSAYPTCNRAFALRMMNTCSYQQAQVSPLDREIQPVIKRPIARSISSKSDGSQTKSDGSQTSSVDTSVQDLELYDIDENSGHSLSVSFDNAMLSKNERVHIALPAQLKRSMSSLDGFNKQPPIARSDPGRNTLPARIRSKNSPRGTNPHSHQASASSKSAGDAQKALSIKSFNKDPQVRRGSSLKVAGHTSGVPRSPLRERKSRPDSFNDGRPKTPAKPVKVAGTKSSQLRAKNNNEGVSKSDPAPYAASFNGYEGDCGKRGKHVNGSRGYSNDYALELELKSNCSIASSMSPNCCSTPVVNDCPSLASGPPPADEFTKKLNDVCQMITEKHPGDFQILETLVNMQGAYEQREREVQMTTTALQNRVAELEEKLRNSPNIPSLVIPMIRASNNFQRQLHKIVTSHKETLNSKESPSVNGYVEPQQNSLDEIYAEANFVAEQILSRQNSRRSTSEEKARLNGSFTSSDTQDDPHSDNQKTTENGAAADNPLVNGKVEEHKDSTNTCDGKEEDVMFV